ncbi:MAG: acyl-CoA thioesterase [Acidimicrobiales bacterium]
MVAVVAVLESMRLEPVGVDRYRAENVATGHPVVFGGQLLAQSVVAALEGNDGKSVKTLHTVFARAASPDSGVDIDVDRVHCGRALASSTVTISQSDTICTRSMVLMTADEPDLMRHAESAPSVATPDAPPAGDDWVVDIVGAVDVSDPEQVGPPELDVWTAFPGAPDDPGVNQGLLSFATDGFLIATAMRPHPGVGQAQAHVSLSTGVLSHTITFHEPFRAGEWMLLAHRSLYAGRGRTYGRADVYRTDGQLVASYVQDSMVRAMAPRKAGTHL